MNFENRELPSRRFLQHQMPSWVGDGSPFFLTICGRNRGQNQFAAGSAFAQLVDSIRFRKAARQWWPFFFVAMPDHVHVLISFSMGHPMAQTVRAWKRFTAREYGFQWQRDFFDHRIRDERSFSEKWEYMANNPVKAALCESAKDWPFQWRPDLLETQVSE